MNKYIKFFLSTIIISAGISVNATSSNAICSFTATKNSALINPKCQGTNYHFQAKDVIDSSLYFKIEKALQVIFDKYDLPGMIVAYKIDTSQPEVLSFGYADTENKIKMRSDHRMLAGSIGKTFVAALILMLENEGIIRLKDPISKYVSDEQWFERLPNKDKITIHHLMTHSSGLVDHVKSSEFIQTIQNKLSDENTPQDFAFSPEELISFTLDKKPLFKSGKGHNYTDTGYILLGIIIEKVTGKSYYSLLVDKVLKPFNLHLTNPSNQPELENLASGYLAKDNPMGLPTKISENGRMILNPATEWTGGGLISNPKDLVNWASLLYEGNLMKDKYLYKLLLNKKKVKKYYYGLGVQIAPTKLGKVYGHGGWFPGFRSLLGYFPDSKVAIATQINTDHNTPLEEIEVKVLEIIQNHKR